MATATLNNMGAGLVCDLKFVPIGPDLTIRASVGTRPAPNLRDDVETIQTALNRFRPDQGGPIEALKVDGICGPHTLVAIRRFQTAYLGWSDGRVDPGKQTIHYLNLEPASLPDLAEEAMRHIARVTGILTATRAALLLLSFEANGLSGFHEFSSPLWTKINRHFHLDKAANPAASIQYIDSIYLRMQTAIGHIPQGVTLFADDPLNKPYYAYSASGGYEVEVRQMNMQGGVPAGSIYLCSKLYTLDDEAIPYVMIHELAHFVGPRYDNPNAITDVGGYQGLGARYDHITPRQALNTADCYSQFAFEAINRPFVRNQHQV
jgi:peptidoglycan hydrolase-like protein with peptidoglycan-binding domain